MARQPALFSSSRRFPRRRDTENRRPRLLRRHPKALGSIGLHLLLGKEVAVGLLAVEPLAVLLPFRLPAGVGVLGVVKAPGEHLVRLQLLGRGPVPLQAAEHPAVGRQVGGLHPLGADFLGEHLGAQGLSLRRAGRGRFAPRQEKGGRQQHPAHPSQVPHCRPSLQSRRVRHSFQFQYTGSPLSCPGRRADFNPFDTIFYPFVRSV